MNVKDRNKLLNFGVSAAGIITKEAPEDKVTGEKLLEKLSNELGNAITLQKSLETNMTQQFKDLTNNFSGVKADNDAVKKAVEEQTAKYAEMVTKHQAIVAIVDQLKKEADAPIIKGGKDLAESDKLAAIELQKRAFCFKGGAPEDFRPDMDNLVNVADYRSACRKMLTVGIKPRDEVVSSLSQAERKAFDAASLDVAFFSPQILGIEVDCNIECADLTDLYAQVSVNKTQFMYPQVESYGDIGSYQCPAKCDAELGPEGNITYKNGRTFDFRGVFCFNRNVLQEANYDLLDFMMRAAARSHRINYNRVLITGDGVNEPQGWLTKDCFTKLKTPTAAFNHQVFRHFIASAPVEYGDVTVIMHQNVFAYLASAVDANGRFIFGDGLMTYSPDDVRDRVRISNCLPDATAGGTLGGANSPFITGDFLAAVGAWKTAYAAVRKRPMFMQQFVGGSTAWCVMYQFGAEDGGFTMCCPAARILEVGP